MCRTSVLKFDANVLGDLHGDFARILIERVRNGKMRNAGDGVSVVKSVVTFGGAVDELIDEDQITGRMLLAQTSACGGDDQMSASELFQRVNVGAEVDVGGGDFVLAAVARNERDGHALDGSGDDDLGRLAVRRDHVDFLAVLQRKTGGRIFETGAANDTDFDHAVRALSGVKDGGDVFIGEIKVFRVRHHAV